MRAGAALLDGAEVRFDAGGDIEQTGAQRAEQPLVSRRGQQIDAEPLDIDRELAGGLRGVDQRADAVLVRDGGHFGDRLDRAGDIRGVRDRDQPGARADRAAGRRRDRCARHCRSRRASA